MTGWAPLLLIVSISCADKVPSNRETCRKTNELCQDEADIECLSEEDWAEMERDVGKDVANRFKVCVGKASTCEEYALCVIPLAFNAPSIERKAPRDDDQVDEIGHRRVDPEEEQRAGVTYDRVTVHSAEDDFGHHLAVRIELTVLAQMPYVGPHVKVEARCELQTDDQNAFFMSLAAARAGDKKVETVTLFDADDLPSSPRECELVLQLTNGAIGPQRFCYRNGETVAAACP